MLSSDIRSFFLSFFKKNGHEIVESSSVVPYSDPSLLFTNSGMVQFKSVFTGLETRNYKKAASSQKCIRAGGKHNDLDQVGFTARHHTFFEMLGNFSFGDYFKEDAIHFAWTLLTKEFSIPKDKLLVTVYHTDEEAKRIWKKVAGNIRIIPISTSDNFWSMGDIGPCGPCSEIFYDHGDCILGGIPGTPDENGDRYIEIWNIVFMQYEQKENGEKILLKNQSIDTGMGLERITAVLQGFYDNYQTDLFRNIIEEIKKISDSNYSITYPSYKVIADHIRSISFLIADGVLPSNEGRGYVLRRILRRAMRHGNMLGIHNPFLFELSNVLVGEMKYAYPELKKSQVTISSIIHDEEEKFLTTLDRGLKILQKETKGISSGGILEGNIAFKLYDTYGFPLDLTQDILKTENISVDVDGFHSALSEQKTRAKWAGSGVQKENEIWLTIKEKLKSVEFVGYEKEAEISNIVTIIKNDVEVSSANSGKLFLVTSSTPFYAESGGQCGDIGIIKTKNGSEFKVINTIKFCDTIIAHEGEVISGEFSVSDPVSMQIDSKRRAKIKANHTATHLLQAALRSILGGHVIQRGSFHDDKRLRFDFSHNAAITKEQLREIEQLINLWIIGGLQIINKTIPKDEALSAGAIALFGEKYGDFVRTVCIFNDLSENISFELCGGTHVSNTSEIGALKILSEVSIGSGIRRIEAITGMEFWNYLYNLEDTLQSLSVQLKCSIRDLPNKIDFLVDELKKKQQEIDTIRQKNALNMANIIQKIDASIIEISVKNHRLNELRSICESAKIKYDTKSIVIVISEDVSTNKIEIVISVSRDLQNQYHAGDLLKIGIYSIGGKGGGNISFAQGGGDGGKSKIKEVLENIKKEIH